MEYRTSSVLLLAILSPAFPASYLEAADADGAIEVRAMDNPVAPVADAGLFKHRGRYYIMGVRTNGQGFWSTDLRTWHDAAGTVLQRSPGMGRQWTGGYTMYPDHRYHVFSYYYLNGVHHIHGSGREAKISHATAGTVTGPYRMKVDPFAPGIDPFVFRDEDGKLYFYTMVHLSRREDNEHWGNNIWVQRMRDPGVLVGERRRLLWAELGWEKLDHRISEGPHVIKYRGLYHLFYNANHTAGIIGNYTIGVAAATTPEGFSNRSERSIILKDNMADIWRYYLPIVPASSESPQQWSFSASKPPANWAEVGYNHDAWKTGPGGFGDTLGIFKQNKIAHRRSRVFREGTKVKGQEIHLRKNFRVDAVPSRPLCLLVRHHGLTRAYLNGEEVYHSRGWVQRPRFHQLGAGVRLRKGINCLAVHCERREAPIYVDVGLYEMLSPKPVDYIYNCGQPNPIRGPNGFEWWMAYFGIWNGSRHAYGFDRIHFHGTRPVADGPTCPNTPGFHPAPCKPTFAGQGVQQLTPGADYRVPATPARNHLIEADLRLKADRGAVGVRLGGDFQFTIDAAKSACVIRTDRQIESPLVRPFVNTAFHHIRIERNARHVRVWLDDVLVTRPHAVLPMSTPALPEFFARGADAEVDAVLYTVGWDEHGDEINGWGAAKADEGGLTLGPGQTVFKGDLMADYEFSAMVDPRGPGDCGVVPVHIDDANWLKLAFEGNRITATGRRGGVALKPQTGELTGEVGPRYVRVVKLPDRVVVFVDDQELPGIAGRWPASGVGLFTGRAAARFNGIMCFSRH